jgi:putative endonuclease
VSLRAIAKQSPGIAAPEAGSQRDKVAMQKQYFVYIMTNQWKNVLYIGLTNNLTKRVYQHKEKSAYGFTKTYHITKLVYYEMYDSIIDALAREKQIKAGSRQKKIELVNSINNKWEDLYKEI